MEKQKANMVMKKKREKKKVKKKAKKKRRKKETLTYLTAIKQHVKFEDKDIIKDNLFMLVINFKSF